MAIATFLAMTAAEMAGNEIFPQHTAWMACHFSSYGTGLTNLPESLPPDSLLILNDRTPIRGHAPQCIAEQLRRCLDNLKCQGLLLDFQQPGSEECTALARYLCESLPCPVAVSEGYAADLNCAVFLPPAPPSEPLAEHLAPWKGRAVWLELALDAQYISLTEQGASIFPLSHPDLTRQGFADESLHCHYHIRLEEDAAEFTLWRTREDLAHLIKEAETLGVTAAVGLYQELSFAQNVL
ncbi:MAG: hypothetical protein IJD98_06785 [Oscillospiraceae bacterium]|nr:hypothetical protein [Oscillospiraceae bacterium]